ncbi:histidine kinase dimerization/phospho-acceptor domain-containing protein [Paenibacillus sp. 1P07SE]|uniref:HAMP domain-containing sensor histidine kinase n=1 Tax=Paenibacillus sp. 1P07SE TaxID=3132209 RepID=UPI0039A6F3A1
MRGGRWLGLKNSLISQYLLLIIAAVLFIPLALPAVSIVLFNIGSNTSPAPNPYVDGKALETMWHKEAGSLAGAGAVDIDAKLRELKAIYPEAAMFWVDDLGQTMFSLPERDDLPERWTPSYTVAFMKKGYNGDPFTVVAFLGQQDEAGFMVMQVPRDVMQPPFQRLWIQETTFVILMMSVILFLFLLLSWLFFYRIRKRLLGLQQAMTTTEVRGIPEPVAVRNPDEIGRLESSFNDMVEQLRQSRQREEEEEQLRRQLIANLSHDLRTPLTAIRSHVYSLQEEVRSPEGQSSLLLIESKISYLSDLIDNLLSYSLLYAGKYPYRPERIDIVRLVRAQAAHWYPSFEEKQFEMELKLPEYSVHWQIDPRWLERILDNLFQNVLRHAAAGRYVEIRVESADASVEGHTGSSIVVLDRGPGMQGDSANPGAGLGLSIVSLMLKEMRLEWSMDSSADGTTITIRHD